MKFLLEINMDNAAFDGEYERTYEVREILDKVRRQLSLLDPIKPGDEHSLRDVNGATVGSWKVVETDTFCVDCPDHEACATGYPCEVVKKHD